MKRNDTQWIDPWTAGRHETGKQSPVMMSAARPSPYFCPATPIRKSLKSSAGADTPPATTSGLTKNAGCLGWNVSSHQAKFTFNGRTAPHSQRNHRVQNAWWSRLSGTFQLDTGARCPVYRAWIRCVLYAKRRVQTVPCIRLELHTPGLYIEKSGSSATAPI